MSTDKKSNAALVISDDISEQAALWVAILNDDEIDEADTIEFEQWCSQHEHHELAFKRMSRIMKQFNQSTLPTVETNILYQVLQPEPSTHNIIKSLTSKTPYAISFLFIFCIFGWYGHCKYSLAYMMSEHQSSSGQLRQMILADGTEILMDSMSSLNFKYSDTERRIVLTQGKVLVKNIAPAKIPFTVESSDLTVTTDNSSFVVSVRREHSTVNVISSQLTACANQAENNDWHMCSNNYSGEVLQLTDSGFQTNFFDYSTNLAWMQHKFIAQDKPLIAVLEELESYHAGSIWYSNIDIQNIRISGTFPTNNIQQSFAILAEHPDLEISDIGNILHVKKISSNI